MKVELEMYVDEDQESIVMEKVLALTKKAEELGFSIVETEVEGGKDEETRGATRRTRGRRIKD